MRLCRIGLPDYLCWLPWQLVVDYRSGRHVEVYRLPIRVKYRAHKVRTDGRRPERHEVIRHGDTLRTEGKDLQSRHILAGTFLPEQQVLRPQPGERLIPGLLAECKGEPVIIVDTGIRQYRF